jgi:hypothetical protein
MLTMLTVKVVEPVGVQLIQILDRVLEHQLASKVVFFTDDNVAYLLTHFRELDTAIKDWTNSK